jgi:hypothetical protein
MGETDRLAAWVARMLADAPPLTPERVATLRAIIRPGARHASPEATEARLRALRGAGGASARAAAARASGTVME